MTGTENLKFVNGHTHDITLATGKDSDGHALNMAGSTTLNSAIQKACGDNKAKFTLVVMHSTVATNLENLNLLAYLKQTDANGVQRDLGLGTWNGRIVLIDDSMPAAEGYYPATAEEPGALLVKDSGASDGQINKSDVTPYFGTGSVTAENYVVPGVQYITYVLGDGAFDYENIGAKVPYEMSRDPKTNGGQDTLYSRQRKVFAPYGISYTRSSQATLSPTAAELEKGANLDPGPQRRVLVQGVHRPQGDPDCPHHFQRLREGEIRLLDKLKLLLGISGEEQDVVLTFVLDAVTDLVLSYCNLDEIPPRLESVVVRMAADQVRSEGYGQAAAPQTAQSVTRGDVTVSYGSNASAAAEITGAGKSLLDDYRSQLNAFRKVRW